MAKKKNEIKELSEILATSLAGRPDLRKRLSSMLVSRPQSGSPGTEAPELTHTQRKEQVREMFRKDFLVQQLKTA